MDFLDGIQRGVRALRASLATLSAVDDDRGRLELAAPLSHSSAGERVGDVVGEAGSWSTGNTKCVQGCRRVVDFI